MEKSVFHCSPSEWKWTSLKLPSPGTYLKTMQRVDPWYQFKTRSQKCRLFILFQAFFYSWLTFWDSGSFSKKEVEIITTSPSRKNSDIIYFTSVFFSISVSKNLFFKIIFCFFIILSNHFGLDHALGRYQKMLLSSKKPQI